MTRDDEADQPGDERARPGSGGSTAAKGAGTSEQDVDPHHLADEDVDPHHLADEDVDDDLNLDDAPGSAQRPVRHDDEAEEVLHFPESGETTNDVTAGQYDDHAGDRAEAATAAHPAAAGTPGTGPTEGVPPPRTDPQTDPQTATQTDRSVPTGRFDGADGADGADDDYYPPLSPTEAIEAYEPPVSARGRPPGARRPPLLVWLITGAFVAILTMCTFLYPAMAGYGEAAHTDLVYSFYNGNAFYGPGDRVISAGVQDAPQGTFPPSQPLADAAVTPRGQRTSFDDAGGDRAGTGHIANNKVEHPPLYYLMGAGLLRLFPHGGDLPYDRVVAYLRYLSILFLAPLPLLAWATARALVGNGAAAVTASALPLAIPGLARVGSSVTNGSLLIVLTASVLFVLARVVGGDLRRGTGVLVGVLTGLACLTQGFALVLPVVVIAAYAVAAIRHRRSGWGPLLIAGVVTALVSGWWWVRNVVKFHTIQPGGPGSAAARAARGPADGGHSFAQYAHDFFVVLGWRMWGGIGLPENPRFSLPLAWTWVGIVLVGVLLALGFGIRGRFGRASALVLLLPALLTVALIFLEGRPDFEFNAYLPYAQGRYLYPAITGLAVLLGVGLARLFGERATRWAPLLAVIGALVTQAWAWRQLLHSWWTPATSSTTDEVRDTVRGILRWSPWAHPVTSATFIAVAALGTLAVLAAVGYGARDDDDDLALTAPVGDPDGEPDDATRTMAAESYFASLS